MRPYRGYLKPYLPLIMAMLLCGQKYMEIANLLAALGVKDSHWGGRVNAASMAGLISRLDKQWTSAKYKPIVPKMHVAPDNIRVQPKQSNDVIISWDAKGTHDETMMYRCLS